MRPAPSVTVQNPVLSQVFTEYMEQAATRLAGLLCLPIVNVPDEAGDITVIRREEAAGDQLDTARAKGGTYNRASWEFDRMAFSCTEDGIEYPLDDAEVARYSRYCNIREINARTAVDNLLKAQEVRIKDELFNATTFSGYTGGITHEWDDATNATPLANIQTAKETVVGNTGMWPDTLLLPKAVFDDCMITDEVVGRLQYVNPAGFNTVEAQKKLLETYFGLDIIIGGSYYNSALEGSAASMTSVWGTEYALVFKRSSGIGEPGIGWTLLWTGDSPTNVVYEEYEEPQTRGMVARVRHSTQSNVFAPEYGYLLSNMTT